MNPYYDPEKMGLEIAASIDYSDGNYQFDYRVVWKHKESGKFYTARDSGCSCPTPFEDYGSISELAEYSYDYVRSEAMTEAAKPYYMGDSVSAFIEKLPRG